MAPPMTKKVVEVVQSDPSSKDRTPMRTFEITTFRPSFRFILGSGDEIEVGIDRQRGGIEIRKVHAGSAEPIAIEPISSNTVNVS